MREQAIQAKLIQYLKKSGCYVVKVIQANKAGVPDILCCYKGHFLAFEVKTPETLKKYSKLQAYNIREIKKCGGFAYIVSSEYEIKQILASF